VQLTPVSSAGVFSSCATLPKSVGPLAAKLTGYRGLAIFISRNRNYDVMRKLNPAQPDVGGDSNWSVMTKLYFPTRAKFVFEDLGSKRSKVFGYQQKM